MGRRETKGRREVVRLVRFVLFGLVAVALVAPVTLEAQQTALTLSSGWKFGGSMGVREGDLNVAAAVPYAAELAFRVQRDASAILTVEYQPTILRLKSQGTGINQELFDIDVWYFMVGGELESGRGPVVPFAMGAAGVAWFNPTSGSSNRASDTMFAGTFGGGVRVPLGQSDRVSFRLEGRINLTIPYGSASIYCGGRGCYSSVGGTVGPVQAALYGGLRFALGPQR